MREEDGAPDGFKLRHWGNGRLVGIRGVGRCLGPQHHNNATNKASEDEGFCKHIDGWRWEVKSKSGRRSEENNQGSRGFNGLSTAADWQTSKCRCMF